MTIEIAGDYRAQLPQITQNATIIMLHRAHTPKIEQGDMREVHIFDHTDIPMVDHEDQFQRLCTAKVA